MHERGESRAPGGTDSALARTVASERVRLAYRAAPISQSAALAVAFLLAWAQWHDADRGVLLAWLTALVAVTALRFMLVAAYFRRAQTLPPPAWKGLFIAGAAASGLVWGSAGIVLLHLGNLVPHFVVVLCIAGMVAAAVPYLAPLPAAFYAFSVPALAPLAVRFLASGHAALGAATLVYLAAMALAAHRTHRAIVTTLALRHENAELVSGLVAEVEERRKAQKELEEALALSRATLDATADGILVANLAGQIVSMNRRFVEIWNVPDALLAEREVSIVRDYVVGQLKDPQAFLLRIRAIHRENVEESRDVIEFRDGRRFESVSVPHRVGDDVVGRVWTFHDVTEQGLRVRAEADNRAKDEFLAMLAHELRNPLGAISNAVRLLSRGADQDRTVAFAAGVIDRQSEQLKRLIDDLLEVSRVVSGKIGLKREPLDLLRAVQQVVQSLGAEGRTREHRITVIGKPAWTNADAARIEQIVINLVVNALAYTPAGRAIEISVREEGGDALLQVKDEGVGMTEETLARVFELFFQAENRLDRPMGGLGIGLALVRRLVALHGGAVTAESDGPGTGSVFKVRLPAMPAPALVHPREGPAGETKRRRVLIVEDNDDGRESLKALLEAYGHEVHAASTGRSALSCMDAIEPEIAIIDLGLPDMNGYDLARTARERHGDRTTLIALTGYGLPEDEIRAYEAGFDAHLAKPADMRRLHALIQGGRALRRP